MSIAAMAGVWADSAAATPAEIAVLIAMADWADGYGYCYPSYPAIADRARVSVRQAMRVVAKFVALGELEKVKKGHRQQAPGHRPGPTGFQARNQYRFTCLADETFAPVSSDTMSPLLADLPVAPRRRSSDTTSPLPLIEEVTTDPGRRDVVSPQEVTPATSHIRNEPSVLIPSVDPSASTTAAAAEKISPEAWHVFGATVFDPNDPLECFAFAWNEAVADPLKRVHTLTKKRRALIRARLVERPIGTWREVIARITASSWCCGAKGFIASFDWLIGSPDPGIRALEGQYDDHVSEQELQTAASMRSRVWGRCRHEPACVDGAECIRKFACEMRLQRPA